GSDAVALQVETENRLAGQHAKEVRARADRLALLDGYGEDQDAALDDIPRRIRVIEQERAVPADVNLLALVLEPLAARGGQQFAWHRHHHRTAEILVFRLGRD